MKKINYSLFLLLMGLVVAGSSCGGSSATATGNANANANTTIAKFGRPPQSGSVKYTAEKLLDIAKENRGFDDQMKGRELVVVGSVGRVSEDLIYFDAGSERTIYCKIDAAAPGPFELLSKRVNDKNRYSKPIAEVVAVFKYSREVADNPMTMTLENCSVQSFAEPF